MTRSRSTESWISSCITGTPASSPLRSDPARSSAIVLRMAATTAPDLSEEATSGLSASTISASVPSGESSLPLMSSLARIFATRSS